MFWQSAIPIFKLMFQFFLSIFCILLCLLMPLIISGFCWYFYFTVFKKLKRPKRTYINTEKNRNAIVRILVDFPRRYVLDMLTRDPDEFDMYGLWCFVGQQGSGKSIALIDMLHRIRRRFPKVKVLSNIDINGADQIITGPEDFVFVDNGKHGMVVVLDEAQNWFNSAESKNFPPEVLQEICQERKQHKMIAMTTQRFNRLSAALREQIDYYVKPMTIAGCLTIVRIYRPQIKEFEAQVVKLRKYKTYFFVHDDFLRGSYDTRAKVARLTLKGWKPRNEHLTADCSNKESSE
ncbi:MAG: hypothetical protein E7505_04605 [Ruminococcus sp.]|nr:hypothetical protein [Ruminococcus sp.]